MTQELLKLIGALSLSLALASAAPVLASQNLKGYVGATVRTYTAQGEPDGEVDWKKAKLPESAPVVAYDLKGHPGIDVSGKTIYLKASDIYLADDKTVCVDLAVAGKKPGSGLTALGVRHGASKTEVTCIPSIPK